MYSEDAYLGELASIVILGLFFGSLLCNAFWIHGSSVASLQRAIAGQNSLAPQRASHFKPRGIGPAIASLVLFVYFALFLALAALPAQVSDIVWLLRVMTSDDVMSLVASHVLVIGLGTLFGLMFFVSLACHAAAGVGIHIGGKAAGLFHPRKNLAATLRYLMRQFVLLVMAAAGIALGLGAGYAKSCLSGMGAPLDDLRARPLGGSSPYFAGCAVVHVLLARQLVSAGRLRCGDRRYRLRPSGIARRRRDSASLSEESAAAWQTCGRRARPEFA